MLDAMCSEVLLSGLLYINNKSMDHMKNNDVFIQYSNVSYVVPDKTSLLTSPCNNEVIVKKVENMSSLIIKTN
jgi:hypothetical protein